MLQLQVIRQDPEWVKQRLGVKFFTEIDLVDEIIQLDDKRKKWQLEFEQNQSKLKSASKEIGELISKGNKEEAEKKKNEVSSLKNLIQQTTTELAQIEKKLEAELV